MLCGGLSLCIHAALWALSHKSQWEHECNTCDQGQMGLGPIPWFGLLEPPQSRGRGKQRKTNLRGGTIRKRSFSLRSREAVLGQVFKLCPPELFPSLTLFRVWARSTTGGLLLEESLVTHTLLQDYLPIQSLLFSFVSLSSSPAKWVLLTPSYFTSKEKEVWRISAPSEKTDSKWGVPSSQFLTFACIRCILLTCHPVISIFHEVMPSVQTVTKYGEKGENSTQE